MSTRSSACANWSGWAGPKPRKPPSWATPPTLACPAKPIWTKCDELSGFLTACALVKPSKAIADVETASVKKKLKDKAFARGVNRQDVIQGAEELGVELDAHIAFCLAAMQRRAGELGL
jgi:predicted hydrolase (HD superfamily)